MNAPTCALRNAVVGYCHMDFMPEWYHLISVQCTCLLFNIIDLYIQNIVQHLVANEVRTGGRTLQQQALE